MCTSTAPGSEDGSLITETTNSELSKSIVAIFFFVKIFKVYLADTF